MTATGDGARGRILVVDDHPDNRDLLARRVARDGHEAVLADNGLQALERLAAGDIDVVLLDIMMPVMDGYEVLASMRADDALRHVPVIVVSAVEDIGSVVRCVEMGADDYLFKPVEAVLLRARLGASLERKRLRDREQRLMTELAAERERSERLLLDILPAPIAQRLKSGESPIADAYDEATVLFADLVDFSPLAHGLTPGEVVEMLDALFARFDRLAARLGVEKVKTIGDTYMAVGGVPEALPGHADAVVELALDMQAALADMAAAEGRRLALRIGVNSGPLVAGVIGRSKPRYDVWGETVNLASRMESHGVTGRIQITSATRDLLAGRFPLEPRGEVDVKGFGSVPTWLLAVTGVGASAT